VTLLSRGPSTLGALYLSSSPWDLRLGEEMAHCFQSIMLSIDYKHIIVLISRIFLKNSLKRSIIMSQYQYSPVHIGRQMKYYIRTNIYHKKNMLFIPPLIEVATKSLSLTPIITRAEDISIPAIYEFLYQSDPSHYYHNVSFSYPKPTQTVLQRYSST